jgi:2-C-methyl-D-erythritol 4-phosphate cytidylyltransferase
VALVGIIPAAGRGERLGGDRPKALATLEGRPLLDWSLDVLASVCDRVVAAVPPGAEVGRDRVPGGSSRSASVRAALEAAPEATLAVVHDAARPLVTADLVARCIRALEPGWDGAIAAARVTDTVKRGGEEGRVLETLERSSLWAVQTPQVFAADALRRALDVDDATLAAATDDASLVEAAGGTVRLVEALQENLKVTTQADLELAAILLRSRRDAAC